MAKIVLIIPSLNPDEKLAALLAELKTAWPHDILLCDDGSNATSKKYFEAAAAQGIRVIEHNVNLGKGRALKDAFNDCLNRNPDLIGCVTADGDAQHTVEDICKTADALLANPNALVLGCRNFNAAGVPSHNAMGNKITRVTMRVLCGIKVSDTQTGLRGIPAAFMKTLLSTQGERFEFETNMLLEAERCGLPFVEVPIKTVYIEQNRTSHFNVFTDSMRIYSLFFKFFLSSTFSSVVDMGLFALFIFLLRPFNYAHYIMAATIAARALSATLNFTLNSRLVFGSDAGAKQVLGYVVLCAVQMFCSGYLVGLFFASTALPELLCKVIVDVVLFLISFQIQRRFIFKRTVPKI